jgi:organic radical activating enzyme
MVEENMNNMEQKDDANELQINDTQSDVKTFTQDEVNEIVEKRLNRERKKFTSVLNGGDPREVELTERERSVEIKELRANALEMLQGKKMPIEVLELLNYADKEACEKSIDDLEKVVNAIVHQKMEFVLVGGKPLKAAPQYNSDYAIAAAFRP